MPPQVTNLFLEPKVPDVTWEQIMEEARARGALPGSELISPSIYGGRFYGGSYRAIDSKATLDIFPEDDKSLGFRGTDTAGKTRFSVSIAGSLRVYDASGNNTGSFGDDSGLGGVINITQTATVGNIPPVFITTAKDAIGIRLIQTHTTTAYEAMKISTASNAGTGLYVENTGGYVAILVEANSTTQPALHVSQFGTYRLINTNVSGCFLSNGGVWTDASSRLLKENFKDMLVLGKLKKLNIQRYNYISERGKKKSARGVAKHFTPMAEDFFKIFGIGEDPDGLSPADVAGVAIQAIKELLGKVEVLEKKVKKLENK